MEIEPSAELTTAERSTGVSKYWRPCAGPALSPAVFRFEPFILAVEARDMQAAQRFIQIARQAEFRESGATTAGRSPQRVMVGIRCSIRLEVSILWHLVPNRSVQANMRGCYFGVS